VDDQQTVDDQIMSLMLSRTTSHNDHDVNGDGIDVASINNTTTSWSDLTSSPSIIEWDVQWPEAEGPTASTDTVSSSAIPRRRRTRQPHSKAAVTLLKAWYDEHRCRPYASDVEVRRLAAECQLGVRQVQKWLSNRRRTDDNTRRRNRPAHNAKTMTTTKHVD